MQTKQLKKQHHDERKHFINMTINLTHLSAAGVATSLIVEGIVIILTGIYAKRATVNIY